MRSLARWRSTVFAGDPRIWRATAAVGMPLLVLLAYWCLKPRDYYTGTNSVEAQTYVAAAGAGQPLCVPDLLIPPGTASIQLQAISATTQRPALSYTLAGGGMRVSGSVAAAQVGASRISGVALSAGALGRAGRSSPAVLCVSAQGAINWGGTPLPAAPADAPTVAGNRVSSRVAVWYLPAAGARSSYIARLASILDRAALFRPGFVGPWLYWLILLCVLPGIALLAVRLLAIAAAHPTRPIHVRRVALALFAIAAVNFWCWALITPAFQAPDEIDHFAYTQTLAEKGEQPSPAATSPLVRWSSSEGVLLEDIGFGTDHQNGTTRVPWDRGVERRWKRDVAILHPSVANGGGYETAATHGPLYYGALVPAYALASSSPLAQLTAMRLASALIGALTVLCAFLLARELAPGRPMLAVTAALLVAFQPMYGFISGAVNNDVGVNAASAGLELLTILVLRRGWRLRLVIPLGLLLLAVPAIKETGLAVYPVVGLGLLAALWRHRGRAAVVGAAALAASAGVAALLLSRLKDAVRPVAAIGAVGAATGAVASSSVSEALAHPFGYLSYLWQVFLPRLPFMARHFPTNAPSGFLIYVERGWGAFGWYDVLFPEWVFYVILAAMVAIAAMALVAANRERAFLRRHIPEAAFILLCPVAVVAGVEAAFYTPGARPLVAEFGRYAFPAIVPLAVIVVGALHALGRRAVPWLGAGLVTAMIALSFAGQLLTLTSFYA